MAAGLENPVLLGLAQAGKQRQDLGHAVLLRQVSAQVIGDLPDLTLARQEHQHIGAACARLAPDLVQSVGNGVGQAVIAPLLKGAPALLDRVEAPADLDDRCRPTRAGKVLGKTLGIDGRRGDDDLEVRASGQQLAQVSQQEIDVEAALMGLVDDQGVVGAQVGIALRLGQQDAIGHEFDLGATLKAVLKSHLVAHHLAQGRLELLGNAFGHAGGGDAPRLGVAHDRRAALAGLLLAPTGSPHGQGDLGQLCGLA